MYDVLGRETAARLEGNLSNNTLTGTLALPNALAGTYYVKLTLAAADGSVLELPVQPVVVK